MPTISVLRSTESGVEAEAPATRSAIFSKLVCASRMPPNAVLITSMAFSSDRFRKS
jgi:hypothetical protein